MEAPYSLRPSPIGGIGAFATRDICIGELILAESPLVAATNRIDVFFKVQALSPANRKVFSSLATSGLYPEPFATFYNNSFSIVETADEHICGLFVTISRFNHSCEPNCSHRYLRNTNKKYIHANRDISAGSELFLTYVDVLLDRNQRQQRIMDTFGFVCHCSRCCQPPDAHRDMLLLSIHQFYEIPIEQQHRFASKQPVGFYKMAKKNLRRLDKEMPWNHEAIQDTHNAATMACNRMKNTKQARIHLYLSYAHNFIVSGPDTPALAVCLDALGDHTAAVTTATSSKADSAGQEENIPVLCDVCGKKPILIACDICGCGQYCSLDCQEQHSVIHRSACKIIVNLLSNSTACKPNTEAQLILRAILQ